MKKFILITFFSLVMSGCATMTKNIEITNLSESESQYVANDAVSILNTEYPVSSTTFRLSSDDKLNFSAYLDAALRNNGYAVSQNNGIDLSYIIDNYAANQFILQLITPKEKFARMYQINSSGIIPIAAPNKGTVGER